MMETPVAPLAPTNTTSSLAGIVAVTLAATLVRFLWQTNVESCSTSVLVSACPYIRRSRIVFMQLF